MPASPLKNDKPVETIESRGGIKLRKYWDTLRGNRPYPSENEIDPEAIADIWESCFLISNDTVTKRDGYRYSYLGKKMLQAYGDDIYNPEIISNLISTSDKKNQRLISNFDEVMINKKPVVDEAEFVNIKEALIRYRISLFPLGENNEVSHILGCMRWRIYYE